jgi:hypothetical protein
MRRTRKHESSDARLRGGLTSSSCEGVVTTLEPRGQPGTVRECQQRWKSTTEQQKKYAISREEVSLAWQRVRTKGGIGGVDGAYSQKIGHLFAERSATPGYPVDNLV